MKEKNKKIEISELKEKLSAQGEAYFKIKVIPGASKTEIKEMMADGTIKISVAAQPEKGKANLELINFLRAEFRAREVKIISGATSRIKLVKIVITNH